MTEPSADSQRQAADTVLEMARGFLLSQMLIVAAKLRIADLLINGPRTADELAVEANAHSMSLYRLLRSLASYGVFTEDDTNRFSLTPLAEPLRSDALPSVRGRLEGFGDWLYNTAGEMLYTVQTGNTAFERVFGMTNWQYRASNPAANAQFNAVQATSAHQRGAAVTDHYNFPKNVVVVDVGGGTGTLLTYIVRANPTVQGVLFDQPQVIADAESTLPSSGLAHRIRSEGGDFFVGVPAGGDIYTLATVLHDWGDADSIRILSSCRNVMNDDSKLLLIEHIMPYGNEPHFSKIADIVMLLNNVGGRERTEREWRSLLAEAGFNVTRIISTSSQYSLIEAYVASK